MNEAINEAKNEEFDSEAHEELVSLINSVMPSEDELTDLSDLFKIFGDETRIRILYVLFQVELTVSDLAGALGMTTSAISHQLKILKASRLVKARRSGKNIFYSLADDHVRKIIALGQEHINEK